MAYTTINKSGDYFNTLTYTGTGSSSTKTGVGFQPDLTWVKARDNTTWNYLYDAVRGAGTDTEIHSNSNQVEGLSGSSTYGYLSAFTSDGFSTVMGSNTGSDGFNKSGTDFVSWNWKANGTGSANTAGSINSTVSVNITSGFSIVKWTGSGANATIGHGLGAVPKMIIVKNLSATESWVVYHGANTSAPETDYLLLNSTNATADGNTVWNDTAPTSSVFSVSTSAAVNGSGNEMIAYCFAEKTGYSKFGSYTGNGNADGTFVYTGFKPALIIIKRSDAAGNNWRIFDNKRSTSGFNVIDKTLRPNVTTVEGSSNIDFISNGVKIRNTDAEDNTSGGTYIYMAIGQSLVGSNNVPCTAR